MSLSLYFGMLSEALYKLEKELGSDNAWQMITEESGVAHVKSIAEGKIKPTINTWQQLHAAFPDKIPPP